MLGRMRALSLVLPILLLTSAGCATKLGSNSLPEVRASYNEAVAASTDEQMLLNIVRLRYLHSTTFLQVTSVTTQYALTTNVGANGNANLARPANGIVPGGSVGGSAGVVLSERPTITYTPLQGPDFVQRLATPLSPEQVLLLIDSGWGADLVLQTCVQQMNGVHAELGPTEDESTQIAELAELLHQLQGRHELVIQRGTTEDPHITLSLQRDPKTGSYTPEGRKLLLMLGLPLEANIYRITPVTHERAATDLAIRARSVLGAMFYLASGVEVPEGDEAAYDYGAAQRPRPLQVRQSKREPDNAYVKVRYQDLWFYIEESDQQSKRAFAFLTFVFNLSSNPGGLGPVLTVGAGG